MSANDQSEIIDSEPVEPEQRMPRNIWDDLDDDEPDDEQPYYESDEPKGEDPEAEGWEQERDRILKNFQE